MKYVCPLLHSFCVLLLAACGGGGGSGAPTVAMVAVTPAMANVMVGQQIQLAAKVTDTMGNVLTGQLAWSSSNSAIATVNSTGLVSAVTLGQVTITATTRGQSGAAMLTTTTGLVFAMVSAGDKHTCGVTSTGTAYCWGNNGAGQLGNGTTANSATPVPVSGAFSFATVSAGGSHSCGITTGGTAYCWGDNSSGQLGNGAMTSSTTPAVVAGGLKLQSISAGKTHTCGVLSDESAGYCWGNNSSGQLGNGTLINSSVPIAITLPGHYWFDLSAGSDHTCGVAPPLNGGVVVFSPYCWGDNSSGQLGNGTTTSSATPVLVLTDLFSVSAGTLYSCGGARGPGASCWGNNGMGQLGNGTMINSAVPVDVSGGFNIAGSVSAGANHACISGSSPSAACWGDNSAGQLGDGSTTNSLTPVVVAGGLTFLMVSSGGRHTCGVTYQPTGSTPVGDAAYCWGDNSFGQLGNSWTTSSSVPVNVAGPP
jgi:alpha-tubulin suppressor-like RCC1 family protein